MDIKPLNQHYSMETPASVYDEEALTALELAGRTTAKVNECVEHVNKTRQDMETQHKNLVASVPGIVADDVQKHISSGAFDAQIDAHNREHTEKLNTLDSRMDSIVADAGNTNTEIVDARVGVHGYKHDTAGVAVRSEVAGAILSSGGNYSFMQGSINAEGGDFYQESTNRIVTTLTRRDAIVYIHDSDNSHLFRVFMYDRNLVYMGCTDWVSFQLMRDLERDVEYVRIVIKRRDEGEITPDAIYTGLGEFAVTVDSLTRAGYTKVTNVPFINGSVNSTGSIVHYDNRLLSPMIPADFQGVFPADGYSVLVACYDTDMTWLGNTTFLNYALNAISLPAGTEYVRFVLSYLGNVAITPGKNLLTLYIPDDTMLEDWNKNAPAFMYDQMDIAYSDIGLVVGNTNLHFDLASHLGFNALKGDVRITRDGQLIMAHDAGYTLNENGYIGAFNANDYVPWVESDFANVSSLRWADLSSYEVKFTPEVCTFETYLKICMREHKIAYITLRDVNIPEVVSKVYTLLVKYGMVERCVINSFTIRTLENVRKYSRSIPVSLVLNHGSLPSKSDVTVVRALGNCILTMFSHPIVSGSGTLANWLSGNDEGYNFAREHGVIVHTAQIGTMGQYRECMEAGIRGFHLLGSILHYAPKIYEKVLTVSGDTQTISQRNWKLPDMSDGWLTTFTNVDEAYTRITSSNEYMKVRLSRLPGVVTVTSDIINQPYVHANIEPDGYICVYHNGTDGNYRITLII